MSQSPSNAIHGFSPPPYFGSKPKKRKRSRSRSPAHSYARNPPRTKKKAPALKLSKQEQKDLGLDELLETKESKKKILDFHLKKQGVKSFDPLSYADLPLEKHLAAKKLGLRYYDSYVPRYDGPKKETTQTVIRQSLIPGSVKPNGQMDRTKKHISELFFSAGPELRDLEPVFKSKSTEAAGKFFELLQNKRKEDLPTDPKWLLACSQILGESWWFGYTFRQQLPIIAKVLHLLESKLEEEDPARQLLNIVYHNFSDSAKVLAQHDLWIHSAAVATKFTANPKSWNELEAKCMKRRKEYRFTREDDIEMLDFYADMVPNPIAMNNRFEREKDAYNRLRRKRRTTAITYDRNTNRNSTRRLTDNRRDSRNDSRRNNNNNRRDNRNRRDNKNRRDNRRDNRRNNRRTDARSNNQDRKTKRDALPPTSGAKNIICHNCGVPGHKSPDCPLRRNKKQ